MNDNFKKEDSDNIENLLESSITGLSPDFIKKHDEIIQSVRKILNDKNTVNITGKHIGGVLDPNKSNTLSEYINILGTSIQNDDKIRFLKDIAMSSKNTQPSGSHILYENDLDSVDRLSDNPVIEQLAGEMQNKFALMSEYGKVVDILTEIGKCIEMLVTDIINCDEITHTFINNFYKDPSNDTMRSADIERSIKDLLKEYDFEAKIRKYLQTSIVTGVKPFSILPHEDVLFMINDEIRRARGLKSIDDLKNISTESFTTTAHEVYNNMTSVESMMVESPISKVSDIYIQRRLGILDTTSMESEEIERIDTGINEVLDPFVKSIITDDIIDEYEQICLEDINLDYEESKRNNLNNKDEFHKITRAYEDFMEDIHNPKNIYNKRDELRNQLRDIVVNFDKSIEKIDNKKVPLYNKSKIPSNDFYKNCNNDVMNKGIIEDFYRLDDGLFDDSMKNNKKSTIKINDIEVDVVDNRIDVDKYKERVKKRRAIITPYEPENVIPVSINGTHYGYYVVEHVRANNNNYMLMKKDKGSFIDIIRRLGYGDDTNAMRGNGTSGLNGSSPYGTTAFSPSTYMGSTQFTAFNPYKSRTSGVRNNISDPKLELMKKLLIKTVSKRLGDENLADTALFQNGMMNVIRDDILNRNNVRFSFIPESHMVYMYRELDDEGYPVSVLNGTLFRCYACIASDISSLMMKVMKSSDVETLEVNVGKSKELGMTIGSISKNASTRNISASTLFGGTDSIFRSVANARRLIIPVINDQKLYEFTNIERMNNVDIDDDFTDRNLKSIILKMGVPPTSLDMLGQEEYAASLAQHRTDYRNKLVDYQAIYSRHITKAIRLLVKYSELSFYEMNTDNSENGKDTVSINRNNGLDLKDIEVNLVPPKHLTVTKLDEEFNSISNLVDSIIRMYFGDTTPEGKEWPVYITMLKKSLIKSLFSSTNFENIEKIIEDTKLNYVKEYNEMTKFNIDVVPDKQDSNAEDENGGFGGGDSGSDGSSDPFGAGGDGGNSDPFGAGDGGGSDPFGAGDGGNDSGDGGDNSGGGDNSNPFQ